MGKLIDVFYKANEVHYDSMHVVGPVFDLNKSFCDHIFDASSVIEAFNAYKEKIKQNNLNHKPTFGYSNGIDSFNNIQDITHKINDVYVKEDKIYTDMDILCTPKGDKIKELIKSGVKMHASPEFLGNNDKISEIMSIGIYPENINSQKLEPLKEL